LPTTVWAAGYGTDAYGGGSFGTGVEPAPEVQISTGGVVIGGPLGIGFVVANATSAPAAAASSSVALATRSTATATSSAPGTGMSTGAAGRFDAPLQYLDRGPDVLTLQRYLNAAGFLLAADGAGAPGQETDFFGSRTYDAVLRFQTAYATEILAPLGLARATGYFGPASILFANSHPQ
jgi:hypothetical protein